MRASNGARVFVQICALVLVGSCTRPYEESKLEPLPTLDLEAAEPRARSQLSDKQAALDRVLALPDASVEERARAFSDLGLLFVAYEFLDSAEVCFQNAVHLEATNFRWHYFLGYAEVQQGRLAAATESLQRVLELEPGLLPAILRLGRAELELGRFAKARIWFERALEIDSDSAAAHEGLGRVEIAEGRSDTGIGHLERALEIDPMATGLNYALAQAHRNVGDLELAKSYLEHSGDVATRIPDPLIDPLAMMAESAQFYLVQAAEAMDDEDFEAAVGSYRAALDQDPKSFVAYRGLARCLVLIGDPGSAIEVLEQALSMAADGDRQMPASERLWILDALAELDLGGGQELAALQRYDQSLEISSRPAVLLRSANLLARLTRFEDALERLDRLLALEPLWAPAIRERRATVLVNLGRKQEAIAEFERAVEAAPEDLRLRHRFAEALAFLGDADRSRAQQEAIARLQGDGAEQIQLMIEEARRLTRDGAYDKAVKRFRSALELAPDLLELRFELASLLGHSGRYGEAEAEFERVITAAPRHEAAHRGLVVAMILGGRFGEARVQLQQTMRTFPRHVALALIQVRLLAAAPDRSVRDGSLALEIASRIWDEHQDLPVQEALALAYAAAGKPDEARRWQERLIAPYRETWSAGVRELMAARLLAFERGEAWSARSSHEIVAGLLESS